MRTISFVTTRSTTSSLATGAYTLPDAACLLRVPLARLRYWLRGTSNSKKEKASRHLPAGDFDTLGEGRDRHFGFQTLIELFMIAQLRERGVHMRTLQKARAELAERFNTPHPFALRGLLTSGPKLLKELGDEVLLELGSGGQTAFERVVEPFCQRLDFDRATDVAVRFYPDGKESSVVVDPKHAFGRPVIEGTNITTEAIGCLIRGGDKLEDIAADYRLDLAQVESAWEYERKLAA